MTTNKKTLTSSQQDLEINKVVAEANSMADRISATVNEGPPQFDGVFNGARFKKIIAGTILMSPTADLVG
jgi:hypothetical protein